MSRQEIVDAIASEEDILTSNKNNEWYNETDRFQMQSRISALYDELAVLDGVQLILDNPEDYYDNEELDNFTDTDNNPPVPVEVINAMVAIIKANEVTNPDAFKLLVWNGKWQEYAMDYIHPADDLRNTEMFEEIQQAFINAYV